MDHVGIDLGAKHSHIAIANQEAEVVFTGRIRTHELAVWFRLRVASRVVVEACTQSAAVAQLAQTAGHEVVVVPGQLVRSLGVGARGIKTDDRDAQVLALASARIPNLPSVHIRSAESVHRRDLVATRETLVDARKRLATRCKSWLRGHLLAVKGRANSVHFAVACRALIEQELGEIPSTIQALLRSYENLTGEIDALSAEIEELANDNEEVKNIMTIPGIGPIVSLAYVAQIDDPHRFASADELGSYLAMVPGESTTGGKVVRTSTIKAGPRYLKALLVQAAWSMWRCRPNDPLVLWARQIAARRGIRIAIMALARKIAVVAWAMWRKRRAYNPSLASSVNMQQEEQQHAPMA